MPDRGTGHRLRAAIPRTLPAMSFPLSLAVSPLLTAWEDALDVTAEPALLTTLLPAREASSSAPASGVYPVDGARRDQ